MRSLLLPCLLVLAACAAKAPPCAPDPADATRLGLEPLAWIVSDHGRRSEVRYRVTDPAKALALLDTLAWPTLVREDDGETYGLKVPLKPGNIALLREGRARAGDVFFLRFSHPSFALRPGQTASLLLGQERVACVPVTAGP